MRPIDYKWYSIGLHLGIPDDKLLKFKEEEDPLTAVVMCWLSGKVGSAPLSWRSVALVLESTSIGEVWLAKRITEKYYQDYGEG